MFKATRPTSAPKSAHSKNYNTQEIVDALNEIFHGKCYLCERADLTDPEIEHFNPHKDDPIKKYDWLNLYYSCSRCNSIKGAHHVDLLDCCDASINVFSEIKCLMTATTSGEISVTPGSSAPTKQTTNTIALLNECYNSSNTGLRGITRSNMINQLFDLWTDWLTYRKIIVSKSSGTNEIAQAMDKIEPMLQIGFPYSVFWRWHVLEDTMLLAKLKHLTLKW
ncbi:MULTISPECIES: HNH endonuclease family protein [Pseudomonas]|uniref:hypothetical protein n=1 Tax=Pseudomonas TaxID=286 RepID=UPI001AE3CF1C|nr:MULTISPECIES: hypothetical protein [unclassified Pseudomonas]MBP1085407.1 uncharacterized protein (TIGR02646 family) [Pseudomonas sp. PvP007]MBP1193556.1 uncharacterized protein (TIGR02646 family) [Pseudomonas sp. PvP100]